MWHCFSADRRAATALEYAIIAAYGAAAMTMGIANMGTGVGGKIANVANAVSSAIGGAAGSSSTPASSPQPTTR